MNGVLRLSSFVVLKTPHYGLRIAQKTAPGIAMRGVSTGSDKFANLVDQQARWQHGIRPQTKLAPLDIGTPLTVMGRRVLERHFPSELVSEALSLLTASKASVKKGSTQEEAIAVSQIRDSLKKVPPEKFKELVNILYVYTTLDRLDVKANPQVAQATPLRDAMTALLAAMPISDAVGCVPKVVKDVLTTHPVKGDSGAVVGLSWTLTDLYQEWQHGIETYKYANEESKPRLCEDLNRLRDQMMECMICLCTTDPVPTVRILPEDEQQNISLLVKKNENQLLNAVHRARRVVLSSFLEKMAEEMSAKDPVLSGELSALQVHSEERLLMLKSHPKIQSHPDYPNVMAASENLSYIIEKWLFDMDGHPLVTGRTGTRAMAAGRVLVFGDVSEDSALVKFSDKAVPSDALATMTQMLKGVESHPVWGEYIASKLKMGWPVVKIYSGLVFFRIKDALKSAEKFQHEPHASFSLMQEGFPHSKRFETLVDPLVSAERALGIRGFWSHQLDLVRLRGIEMGAPHIRIGESFFAKLLSQAFHVLFPAQYASPQDFLTRTIVAQKELLSDFIAGPSHELPLGFDAKLDAASGKLYAELRNILSVSAFATIIASDSAGEHGDAATAILVLKAISKLMGHRGMCYPLFEDKRAMESAIALLRDKTVDAAFFDRVGVQTAGSDNQKREGPFLSARLNYAFLIAARERGIPSFFGRGCSPFRSATSDFPFDMVTVQPGQLHHTFNTVQVMPYLLSRVAKQISAETYRRTLPEETKRQYDHILGTIADHAHEMLKEALSDYPEIRAAAAMFSSIQTNFHSRPPSKQGASAEKTDLLMTMRAIGLAKFQTVAGTVDPQMAGALSGVRKGIAVLVSEGVSLSVIHDAYRNTPEGKAILETLVYFHDLIDPAIPTQGIRKVSDADIAETYRLLTGGPIPEKQTNPTLRLARCLFLEAPKAYLPDTLLLLPAV